MTAQRFSPPARSDAPEVLVVGAGPVGLALALGLARAGRRVLVLEKNAGTAEHSRAGAIWPRTLEILDALGVVDSFLAEGILLPRFSLNDADHGGELVTLPLDELEDETAFPYLMILPQSRTERLLLDAVRAEETAAVRFSAEVESVRQDERSVEVTWREGGATETLTVPFLAGCDGAHSVVRSALGASLEGATYEAGAALADIAPEIDRDLPFPRLSTRGPFAIAIRLDEGLWRLILPFAPGDETPLDQRIGAAAFHLFPEPDSIGLYERVWESEFRLHRRVATRWVDGRIALAGDAAHLNSPVGGQGMNAGIQDAAALTWALLRALKGEEPRILEAYEAERRLVIERGVNPFTDRLTRVLLAGDGRLIRNVLRVASAALRVAPLRRRFLRGLAMLPARAPD